MDFRQAVVSGFNNNTNFKDRAPRSAYWWWVLFGVIVGFLSGIIDEVVFSSMQSGPVGLITSLALFVPGLAVGARRLHDLNKSGWWQLIAITIIGIIPLIYWYCQPGDNGDNRFGPPQK